MGARRGGASAKEGRAEVGAVARLRRGHGTRVILPTHQSPPLLLPVGLPLGELERLGKREHRCTRIAKARFFTWGPHGEGEEDAHMSRTSTHAQNRERNKPHTHAHTQRGAICTGQGVEVGIGIPSLVGLIIRVNPIIGRAAPAALRGSMGAYTWACGWASQDSTRFVCPGFCS